MPSLPRNLLPISILSPTGLVCFVLFFSTQFKHLSDKSTFLSRLSFWHLSYPLSRLSTREKMHDLIPTYLKSFSGILISSKQSPSPERETRNRFLFLQPNGPLHRNRLNKCKTKTTSRPVGRKSIGSLDQGPERVMADCSTAQGMLAGVLARIQQICPKVPCV